MLTLQTSSHHRNCEGLTRRDWLRFGSLRLGGLALPDLLHAKAAGPPEFVRDKAVVVLSMGREPNYIETFNSNMDTTGFREDHRLVKFWQPNWQRHIRQ